MNDVREIENKFVWPNLAAVRCGAGYNSRCKQIYGGEQWSKLITIDGQAVGGAPVLLGFGQFSWARAFSKPLGKCTVRCGAVD